MAPAETSIRDRICAAGVGSPNGKLPRFWPEGSLDSIITLENPEIMELIYDELIIEPGDPIIDFIVDSAKNILTIIFIIDFPRPMEAMELFKSCGLSDEDLPLEETYFDGLRASGDKRARHWDKTRSGNFLGMQWRFLATSFNLDNAYHQWPSNRILPFINEKQVAGGAFGKVSRCEIHQAHVTSTQNISYLPKVVAMKKLEPEGNEQREEIMKNWKREAEVLRKMNDLDEEDSHIVRFFTAVCIEKSQDEAQDKYSLMFEWADGGNLRNLWDEKDLRPRLRRGFIEEAVTQLHGLARALCRAHYPDDLGRRNYRHTDLKPPNILWFKDEPRATSNFDGGAGIGRLKIGDWGLAQEIDEVTDLRPDGTSNHAGTRRYEPPEESAKEKDSLSVPDSSRRKRSRLYDIWAMGCVTLEFIIWLMYGPEVLKDFNKGFSGSFYELNMNKPASVNHVVKEWIEHMKKDPICQAGSTALGDLLEVVETRLLVVKIPPYGAGEPPNKLSRVSTNDLTKTLTTSETTGGPQIVLHSAPASASPTVKERDERANAKEYERCMNGIITKIVRGNDADDTYWFMGEAQNDPPISKAVNNNNDADFSISREQQNFHGQLTVHPSRAFLTSSRRGVSTISQGALD